MSLLDKATIITTPTAHSNGKLHSIKGGAVSDFDVVRNSVATRVASNGLIESVATNIPRIDYTTGEGVILTEPQRTNLITQSEAFGSSYWTKSGSSVVGGFASPSADSPLGAFKLVENTSTGVHGVTSNVSGLTTSNTYTISFYAKKAENNYIYMRFRFAGSTDLMFNLDNGTMGVGGSNVISQSMTALANGWYKCTITALASGVIEGFRIYTSNNGSDIVYTGDGTSGVYIFGAQLEALPYSTSYIPTSGAIATRLADSLTGAGDATTFNSTEGVLYVEIAALANDLTDRSLSLSSGSYSNRIELRYNNSSNGIRVFGIVGGAFQFDSSLSLNLPNITNQSKLAIKYKENNFALWVNGFEVYSDLSGSIFSEGVLNEIKFSDAQGGSPFYGKTKTIAVFSEALTDEELTCLTTI